MRRRGKELLNLSFYYLQHPLSKPTPPPISSFKGSTFSFSTTSKSQRDSMLLQKFKERKLKGSSNDSKGIPKISASVPSSSLSGFDIDDHKGLKNESEQEQEQKQEEKEENVVVGGFKELGLSEEVVEVIEEIGEFVPSEIQCVVIPAVLEGKSVLLSSPSKPDRILAYLLPIIQLLRRDKELLGSNSKHPRALVLCASEEKAEQCFNAAAHIIHNAELKSAKNRTSSNNEKFSSSIGLMIGTPSEILQYIEEGTVVPAELSYLVLDEADFMLDSNLGAEIHEIIKPLQHHESKSTVKKLQTILAISTIAEVLGEKSPIVQRIERDHAGSVSAMSLEMEETEVFDFIESLDALKKKLAEAMTSL